MLFFWHTCCQMFNLFTKNLFLFYFFYSVEISSCPLILTKTPHPPKSNHQLLLFSLNKTLIIPYYRWIFLLKVPLKASISKLVKVTGSTMCSSDTLSTCTRRFNLKKNISWKAENVKAEKPRKKPARMLEILSLL